jgi:quercetin dioxygenase-like cupin family protein
MLALVVSLATVMVAQANQGSPERRLTPRELAELAQSGPGAGTSGVAGIRTTVLEGDPTKTGLYAIRLHVPANTRIEAHSHRDDRSATVVSGTWNFGYGDRFDAKALKALPPGSFYTEPPGRWHFAQTGAEPVLLHITGYGPTDTIYATGFFGPDPGRGRCLEVSFGTRSMVSGAGAAPGPLY